MQKSDISFLKQLVKSLEDAETKLKRAYDRRNTKEFDEIKRFMLRVQKQIKDILK